MKDRNILFNFIFVGSAAIIIGCLLFMFSNSFGFNSFDTQIFIDIGFLIDILLLNIGLIYKFNHLSQKEVKDQKQIIKELKEKERLSHELLNVRKRISMDIHDDVLGGLSTIRISSDLIKNTPPEVSQAFAKKISDTAKDTAQRLNTIIWSLDNENDELINFIAYVKEYSYDFFEDSEIAFTFLDHTNLSQPIKLSGDIRKNLFFTIKEALHNILKHAKADISHLSIALEQQKLQIKIVDNGIGFTTEKQFGNGLKNMRRRIEMLGGSISFFSSQGTTIIIELSLPLENE